MKKLPPVPCRLIALLLLVTFSVAQADSGPGPRPLGDAQRLGGSIERYVQLYNGSKIDPAQGTGDTPVEPRLTLLSGDIAELGNAGKPSQRALRSMKGLVGLISSHEPATFNETVAALVADYYEHPARRDALAALIDAVSDRVEPELALDVSGETFSTVLEGTMAAWTVLTIWNWRGGKQGLADDASRLYSGVGKGWRWALTKLKGQALQDAEKAVVQDVAQLAPVAAEGAVQEGRLAKLGKMIPSMEESKAALVQAFSKARDRVSEAPGNLVRMAGETWRNRGTVTKEAVRKAGRFVVDLTKSLAVGGGIAGIYSWEKYGDVRKVDPRALLRAFQAFAILDLEQEAMRLVQDAQQVVGGSDPRYALYHSILKGDPFQGRVSALVERLRELKAQLEHFRAFSPEFEARIEMTGDQLRSTEEIFCDDSAGGACQACRDSAVVSLVPIQYHLARAESVLLQFAQKVELLNSLAPEQREELFQVSLPR